MGTEQRLLAGFLAVIGLAVSFGLTVFLFGFVVLAGLILGLIGLALLASGSRRAASGMLLAAAVVLSGPLLYVALALLV